MRSPIRKLWTLLLCYPLLAHAGNAELLIRGGYVMTMDPERGDLADGDILIRDGRIVSVGHALDAPEAQVIDATDTIVLPGFVDTHSHLSITTMRGQFRNGDGRFFPVASRLSRAMQPEDIHTAMYTGALELLAGGITTTADFFDNVASPAHGEAGLKALQDAGIRAQLYFGGPDKSTRQPIDLAQLRTLAARAPSLPRITLGLAWRLPRNREDADNWAMRQQEYDTAQSLGLPIQVHVSGEPGPMFDALIERGYLRPGVTVVHATDASEAQLRALERAGGGLSLTPLSEHRVGYGLTRIDHFDAVSRQGLGIDGNSLAGTADMFSSMRLAALTWSGQAQEETGPDPRELLTLATRRGAAAIGLDDRIGTLSPGKRADLQIIDLNSLNLAGFGGGDPAALLVYSARPSDVRTVIVDGQIVKHEGHLTQVDLDAVVARARLSARRLLQDPPSP